MHILNFILILISDEESSLVSFEFSVQNDVTSDNDYEIHVTHVNILRLIVFDLLIRPGLAYEVMPYNTYDLYGSAKIGTALQ